MVVTTIPKEMGEKFGRHIMGLVNSVHKTQQKWNEIYFKKLDTNTEHVKTLQEANQAVVKFSQIKFLILAASL